MTTPSARPALARLEPARLTDTALQQQLTQAQRDAFNKYYKDDQIPPWALFILLVSEYSFVAFYRPRKIDVDLEGWVDWTDDKDELERHIRWNTVLLLFRTALRRTDINAFLDLLPVAAGAMAAARGNEEETEEVREAIALAAIPPEIVELIRLAVYSKGPEGYVLLLWPLDSVFWKRYKEMRSDAYEMVRRWFSAREIEYDQNIFGSRGADEANGEGPDPPPPKEDKAPCPYRDRKPGGSPERPCETEEEEFERLGRTMLGVATEKIVLALTDLAARRGCGSPGRFCMSPQGKRLGVCDDQKLWQRMCENMGWTDNPPVLRTVQTTPNRRVYADGELPRLVFAIRRTDYKTELRELEPEPEPEFETVPGERETRYDWHAQYMKMCSDKE